MEELPWAAPTGCRSSREQLRRDAGAPVGSSDGMQELPWVAPTGCRSSRGQRPRDEGAPAGSSPPPGRSSQGSSSGLLRMIPGMLVRAPHALRSAHALRAHSARAPFALRAHSGVSTHPVRAPCARSARTPCAPRALRVRTAVRPRPRGGSTVHNFCTLKEGPPAPRPHPVRDPEFSRLRGPSGRARACAWSQNPGVSEGYGAPRAPGARRTAHGRAHGRLLPTTGAPLPRIILRTAEDDHPQDS